jgi:hypothetical protein
MGWIKLAPAAGMENYFYSGHGWGYLEVTAGRMTSREKLRISKVVRDLLIIHID